jgi:hypothetical protein
VLAQDAGTLMLIGGYQSNHTRHVWAVAARLGLKCLLLQEKWVDSPDPMNDRVGNIMLSRIMDAEVRLDPPDSTSVFAGSATRLRANRSPANGHGSSAPTAPAQRAAVGRFGLRAHRGVGLTRLRRQWPASTAGDRLPTVAFWLLSAAIGIPIIARAIKRPTNRSAAPDHSARG